MQREENEDKKVRWFFLGKIEDKMDEKRKLGKVLSVK